MDFKGATKEEIIRELERKSNDSIKIYNPTTEEFAFKWNGYLWHCPPKTVDEGFGMGCFIVPRYIANHYVKHMTDRLIMRESDRMLASYRKKYTGNDWNREEERLALRTNNPSLIEKYARTLWKGKVRDYGLDRPVVEEQPKQNPDKPVHLAILDRLEEEETRVVEEKPAQAQQDYITELAMPNDTQG